MAAKGDVELIVRAKNEATKNLDQINKSLKDLSDQQKIVGDSAGKADDQLSRLGLELAKLRTNAQNLKALSTVSDVVDKAALALERQRQAAQEAQAELTRVSQRQKELGSASTEMNNSLKAATNEVKRQQAALDTAKSSLGDLSKEATSLASSEKNLQSAIKSAQTQLTKRQTALDEATQKQERMAQAVASSEKVTKAQQNSLDAANRTLERRQKALAETVAKEAELQQKLSQVRAAIAENTAAALNANSAYTQQSAKVTEAATAAQKLKVEADGLTGAHREIAKDVQTATAAVDRQSNSLKEAESEYSQVQTAAASARAAVAGTASTTKDAGTAAGRAAVQVATFAARLAVLSGAGGGATSKPQIIDPKDIREAEASLTELGVTIRAAGNDAAKASVSSKEMATALKGVGQAQSTLQSISSAIGAQAGAVDGAKQAWKTAEAEVRRLAIAIREADEPSEQLAAAFGKAQGAARLAKDEFLRQKTAADQIGQSLKNAGIGAGDLASAEAALAPKIQRANDLMNQGAANAQKLGTSVRQTGSDAGSAAPQVSRLATALGLAASSAARLGSATNPLRAFKNELFAMIAASAGLYAIKEQLQSIWQAGTDLAANQSKFATAFGGIEEGGKQLAYAREVALNLKLPLGTLTKSYADLALAAKGTALEGKGAQDIFVAFAQTARVNGSTADDLSGTFRALTQIMSKGKVQAEELRGQLGDRMPGAMQLMAEGLGITTEKLDKMMEKGELTRATLLNMAAAASGRVSAQLAAALDSPAAKLADFQNRLLVFKEQIAGSGFLDAMADAFDRMAKALSTPEAADAARMIGEGLADIVTWATELVASGNLDTIVTWVKNLGIAWAGLQMASIISMLYGFVTAIGATTIAVFGLDVAMAPVLVGLAGLAAAVAVVVGAFAGWKLAEWAYDNFPAFAEGVMSVKNAALSSWDAIMQFWEITGAKLKASFTGVTAKIRQMWYGLINDIMSVAPEITARLGLGDYAKEITARFADANQDVLQGQQDLQEKLWEINNRYGAKERDRNKQLQDDIAAYHQARINTEERQEQNRNRANVRGGAPMAGTGTTGLQTITADPYKPDTSAADEKAAERAAKKRLQLEQNVANQMFGIRSQLEQKSAQTLDEQLAAVPAKYAKLFGQLTALGKDKTSQEWKDVEALIAQEQRIIRQNQLKKDERAAAKAERAAAKAETDSQKEAMNTVNALLQTRKNLQEQLARAEAAGDTTTAQELKEKLVGITEETNNAINGMLAYWQAVGGPEADLAIAKLEKMKLTLTKTRDTAILTQDAMGKAFGSNLKSGIDSFVDKLAETGDMFGSLKEAFREFAINFLKDLAKMILQQMVFNALKSIGGGFWGSAAGAVAGSTSASVNHSGGTIGGVQNRTRTVSPALFQNAARFHNGSTGVPGLKSGEVPAILEAGETVRTQQQEKALADRMAAGSGASEPSQLNIYNNFDAEEVYAGGANSPAMGKTVINQIRLNRTQIKQLLG